MFQQLKLYLREIRLAAITRDIGRVAAPQSRIHPIGILDLWSQSHPEKNAVSSFVIV